MMYPRLVLLREFLTDDGAIFASIDDNEVHTLRVLMNEIFGTQRFVATIAWQKRYSRENRGAIGDAHEYILVYAKDIEQFKATRNRVPMDARQAKVYKNPNNDPRGRWRGIPMTAQGYRPNQMYPITTPSGKVVTPPKGRCWSTIEPEFEKLRSAGRIWFGKNGSSAPSIIRYLDEVPGLVPWTWWPHDEVGHTDEAKKEILALDLDGETFDTPKPVRLIQRIVQIASSEDSIVLDSFAGSGTTGHAVMAQNKADGGNRRFILVEMDENICRNVTAQRFRKAIASLKLRRGAKLAIRRLPSLTSALVSNPPSIQLGLRFCKLGAALFDEAGNIARKCVSATWRPCLLYGNRQSDPEAGRRQDALVKRIPRPCRVPAFQRRVGRPSASGGNVLTHDVAENLPEHPVAMA